MKISRRISNIKIPISIEKCLSLLNVAAHELFSPHTSMLTIKAFILVVDTLVANKLQCIQLNKLQSALSMEYNLNRMIY